MRLPALLTLAACYTAPYLSSGSGRPRGSGDSWARSAVRVVGIVRSPSGSNRQCAVLRRSAHVPWGAHGCGPDQLAAALAPGMSEASRSSPGGAEASRHFDDYWSEYEHFRVDDDEDEDRPPPEEEQDADWLREVGLDFVLRDGEWLLSARRQH
ncbi:rho GTPase-activating protein 18 [Ixodes scapularis]